MHRPVVKQEVLDLMRKRQPALKGLLGEVEKEANELGIPVIPHETVVFMQFLLGQLKPKNILEIGAAIGFSASLMAEIIGAEGHVTTIDRYDLMIQRAKKTFTRLGLDERVTLLEGEAVEILPTLKESYDFIFMDSAKSKYIEFLPYCLNVLKKGGVLMIDDVFQAGTVMQPIEEIPRNQRTIYRKLNKLYDVVFAHPDLTVSAVPLGDGVLLITKEADDIVIPEA